MKKSQGASASTTNDPANAPGGVAVGDGGTEQPVLPPPPTDRLDRKTLIVFLGFCAGLVLLVVLNMK